MPVDYPFHFDERGHTAKTDHEDHIRDLIEQVLFTAPGERVNRPEFGTGVRQLVFAPNSAELATATQFMIQGALQQWLAELIQVDEVQVVNEDAALTITVAYRVLSNNASRTARFRHEETS